MRRKLSLIVVLMFASAAEVGILYAVGYNSGYNAGYTGALANDPQCQTVHTYEDKETK